MIEYLGHLNAAFDIERIRALAPDLPKPASVLVVGRDQFAPAPADDLVLSASSADPEHILENAVVVEWKALVQPRRHPLTQERNTTYLRCA